VTDRADISPGGAVFQGLVEDALAHEFERRKSLESRGAVLLASSGTMVTIVLGLTVLITGKDAVFADRRAVLLLCAALIPFVLSAVAAIFVQSFAFKYDVIKQADLDKIVEDEDYWNSPADIAARESADIQVKSIRSLRSGNAWKARFVLGSFFLQMAAIALMASAIGSELVSRLHIGWSTPFVG
jgi:hypothetical protein